MHDVNIVSRGLEGFSGLKPLGLVDQVYGITGIGPAVHGGPNGGCGVYAAVVCRSSSESALW